MDKLKNYIYLSICEIAHKRFEASNFTTFNGYCNSMKSSLSLRDFSKKELDDIIIISDYIKLIYGLRDLEIGEQIDGFFNYENYLDFYNYMILCKDTFPHSIG